jgi:LysM repeat protein
MYVWSGSAWVSVASEVESLAGFATQSYADNQPGMKLIVPSSVAVGSGSGSVATQGTVTFSGASSVSLNDVFSATYNNYKIIVRNTTSDNVITNFRLRVSGADNSTANYSTMRLVADAAGGVARTAATGQTSSRFLTTSVAGSSCFVSCDISSPFLSERTYYQISSSTHTTDAFVDILYSIHNVASSFTGFTLFPSSGNITGTIQVYGYKAG